MPFTFSHPIAAIPFARFGLPLSALIVGSMTPDFPYFLHGSTSAQYGHTLMGTLLFCVPVGLVALWLWHRVLDVPLRSLLPISLQEKLLHATKSFQFWPAKKLILIIIALLIGATTHIVWDSFTHANGFAVSNWSPLREPIFTNSHGTIYLFKVLQHGSGLLGAIALLWLGQRELRNNSTASNSEKSFSHLVFPMAIFAATCAMLWAFTKPPNGELQTLTRDLVISFVVAICVALIAWSIWWRWKAGNLRSK